MNFRTMKHALCALAFFSNNASAEDHVSGVYLCTVIAAGGIYYNEDRKEWDGSRFKAGYSIIFKIEDAGVYSEKNDALKNYFKDDPRRSLNIEVSEAGEELSKCFANEQDGWNFDIAFYSDIITCYNRNHIYHYSYLNKRLQRYYITSFISGDGIGNTPLVEAATCTKISN